MSKFFTDQFHQIKFEKSYKSLSFLVLALLTYTLSYGQIKISAPYCTTSTYTGTPQCQGVSTLEKLSFSTFNFNTPCPISRTPGYNFYQAANFPNYTATLTQGENVTITLSGSSSWNYFFAGVWIDFNGDYDYTDAGEFIGSIGSNVFILKDGKLKFTVPCTSIPGVTRMRVRVSDGYSATWLQSYSCGYPGGNLYGQGEDLDFEVTIAPSGNPTANFQIPDTIFQNSPAQFYNINQTGYTHEWFVDEGSGFNSVSTSTNLEYAFYNAGTADVRVTSSNCTGSATTTKTVTIIVPKDIPTPQFYASLTNIEVKPGTLYTGDKDIFMYDFSTGGPDTWDWSFTSPDPDDEDFLAYFIDYYNQNPLFITFDTGTFSICLTVSNMNGSNTLCKNDYIKIDYPPIGSGGNSYENIMCQNLGSTLDSGIIYDNGGKGDYVNNGDYCVFSIASCDAEYIELNFSELSIDCQDYIYIYDGVNSKAPLLKSYSSIDGAPVEPLRATSGFVTIEFIVDNNTWWCNNFVKGFAIKWKTIKKNDGGPKANFVIPKSSQDTVFACSGGTEVQFKNESSGSRIFSKTQWIFDYTPNISYPVGFNNSTAVNPSFNYTTTNKWYNVRLVVESCEGNDTVVRSFFLANNSLLPKTNFTVNNNIIYPNQTAIITNTSAGECSGSWSISPNTWSYVTGNQQSDVIEVKFLKAGRYNVTRTSTNQNGTISKTKSEFIRVIEYCEPTAQFLSTESGISNVKFAGIDNSSASAENAFENFTSLGIFPVTMGQTYPFEMSRKGHTDPVDRIVWIDYDRNGIFSNNEIAATEFNSYALSFNTNIIMPDYKNAVTGLMRMRVACAIAGTPIEPCGPVKLGEYEDYLLDLRADEVLPVLTVIGTSPVYLEIGQSYNDEGATAFDNIEGDITHKIITQNNVEVNQAGINEVIYEITDNSGLKSRAIRRVIVKADITNPEITIAGGNDIIHEVKTVFTPPTATVIDNPGNNSINYQIIANNVNINELGIYNVVYQAIDAYGNASYDTLNVEVKDQTAPVFHLNGSDPYRLQLGQNFVEPTTVTDNYNHESDIDITVTGLLNTNVRDTNYILNYTATDESGNTTTLQRRFIVGDFISPVINTLAGTEYMIVEVKSKFTEPNVSVSDNFGGATLTRDGGGFDINKLGTYTITYSAKDLDGNAITYKRIIEVVDTEIPIIQNGVINLKQWQTFDPTDYSDVYVKDNYYSSDDFKNGTNGCKIVSLGNDVKTQTPGLYYACYQAIDGSDNISAYNCILVKVAESTTGIEHSDFSNTIQIYPNPSNGDFMLGFSSGISNNVKINITNMLGETIVSYNYNDIVNNKISIDLNSQASGVYFVNVQDDKQIATKKITLTK